MNDLTELHQNEIHNLKQELASMEEKVAYQSYERARDIQVTTHYEECANVQVSNLKQHGGCCPAEFSFQCKLKTPVAAYHKLSKVTN